MEKQVLLQKLSDTGVVAVIRTDGGQELIEICRALDGGGLAGIEITMTSPGALEAIGVARKVLGEGTYIGAGSILDPETARNVLLAGADFIVSPVLNEEVIKMGRRYGRVVIPGAFTPTEILRAWEAGADVVKVFPATRLGPSFIKDVLGPLPQVKLTPTGGVDLENLPDFLRAGASFVCVGSALITKELIKKRDWSGLTERTKIFMRRAREAR